MGWSPEEASPKLPRVLSQESHTGCAYFLQQELATTRVRHCRPGELVRDLVLKVFTGGYSPWGLLGTNQNARLWRRFVMERKTGIQHKPYCLHGEPRLSSRENVMSVPGTVCPSSSRIQPRANLANRPLSR